LLLIIKDIHGIGGAGLLNYKYNGSLVSALHDLFPTYDWLPWKFVKCPQEFWDDKKNQRKFLDWAATQLDIKDMSDWYRVTQKVTKHILG
jgi:hypothetical protein